MSRVVLVLFLIVAVLLSSCSPAMMPATPPETPSGEVFVVALPRVVVTTDAAGQLDIEGLPLRGILTAMNVSPDMLALPDPAMVQSMTAANIQHIELRQTGNGIAILVNGLLLPHLYWQEENVRALGDLAYMLGPGGEQVQALIEKVGPILARVGLSVAVKFPLKDGEAAIPFASDEVALAAPAAPTGTPSAVVAFEVKYDEQGVPSIMGISAAELAQLTGNYSMPLALGQDTILRAQAVNIQTLQITSQADGLHLYVNGTPLPSLAWDQTMLDNTISLAVQVNPQLAPFEEIIKSFTPILTQTYISVLVHFPLAPGVEPLPIKMQVPNL